VSLGLEFSGMTRELTRQHTWFDLRSESPAASCPFRPEFRALCWSPLPVRAATRRCGSLASSVYYQSPRKSAQLPSRSRIAAALQPCARGLHPDPSQLLY
jgi:hypothetical protein